VRGARWSLLLMAVGFSIQPFAGPAKGQESTPNILVILTDDQRATGTVTPVAMPSTLEWFAVGGIKYPNAYATTPLCCPSRASLFTGQYAHNHRVLANDQAENMDQDTTVQAALQRAGYLTGFTGKYMNGWPFVRRPPHFDRWSMVDKGYHDPRVNRNGTVVRGHGYGTEVIRREALSILDWFETRDPQAPWLLFVHTFAPHAPLEVEREHRDAPVGPWDGNPAVKEKHLSDKPPYVKHNPNPVTLKEGRRFRRLQLRMLMTVDELVDDLLTVTDENTFAMFLSDNGFMWGEHGLGGKVAPYQQSPKIPMYLRWPGHVSPGVKDQRLAAVIDVAPTIFDATGVAPGWEVDGRSLLTDTTRNHLLLESYTTPRAIPKWRGYVSLTDQYFEYRRRGDVIFREHYRRDPWQLENRIRKGRPLTPYERELAATVAREKDCAGTTCP
jgi:arylsulfatase A-like enzyme